MYGVRFVQAYGWYINQAYLRVGIYPGGGDYLSDVCPEEYQKDILAMGQASRLAWQAEEQLRRKVYGRETSDDEGAHHLSDLGELQKKSRQAHRSLEKKIENLVREEFGLRKVGERWVSETILYQIVTRLFPEEEIYRHYRPDWLEGLELDIYIPGLRLAFEYQGQQHYHPIEAWGGQEALNRLQERDAHKAKLCKQVGVKLVTVDYTEPLTESHIRQTV
jgi:hypothetical protein